MKYFSSAGLFLALLMGIHLSSYGQYYSPHSRKLETYKDLPEVMIRGLDPAIASDLTYLKCISADTFLMKGVFTHFMQTKDTLFEIEFLLYPGSQKVILPLLGLSEGWYQVQFFCKNRKVGIRWLQICR